MTVVDDGSIADRRGSLSIDDEGTPTQENVLIEDGILKGYMQDRLNARLMGVAPTGNGRRESFAHAPMPRMTNTFMLGGKDDPGRDSVAASRTASIAKSFGGGQVDIISGKFVFTCTEAYKIENGKLGAPIKGATLIGDGPSVLTRVQGIGNDIALDEGVGMCGKGGQSRAGGRRPADVADRWADGRRHGGGGLKHGARRDRELRRHPRGGNGTRHARGRGHRRCAVRQRAFQPRARRDDTGAADGRQC